MDISLEYENQRLLFIYRGCQSLAWISYNNPRSTEYDKQEVVFILTYKIEIAEILPFANAEILHV